MEKKEALLGGKKVAIQKLDLIPAAANVIPDTNGKAKFSGVLYCNSNVMANWKNTKYTELEYGIAGALWAAYNYHSDVVLSPDDVWLTICHAFSLYVNANSEALRSKFVDHEGKETILVITESNPEVTGDWAEVLTLFGAELGKRVKQDTAKVLHCDFSTTGPIEKAVSNVSLMTTFQNYFRYHSMTMCGIRNVVFLGELKDWTNLKAKLIKLNDFGCEKWTQNLAYVIDKFIDTYNGNVDVEFWNNLVKLHGPASGKSDTTITGWISAFIPITKKGETVTTYTEKGTNPWAGIALQAIPEPIFIVPFKHKVMSQPAKQYQFRAGFTGLRYENETFRPQLSYAVTEYSSVGDSKSQSKHPYAHDEDENDEF